MNAVAEKYAPLAPLQPPTPRPKGHFLLFLLICTILGVVAAWQGKDFLELDHNGEIQISAQREKQLNQRLKRLNQAEQYVLLAKMDGWYPCYSCETSDSIYLFAGEVWRYGVTIRGEKGRVRAYVERQTFAFYCRVVWQCVSVFGSRSHQNLHLPQAPRKPQTHQTAHSPARQQS